MRVANAFDGAPDLQAPIAHGGSIDYELTFPDAGPFWYHPHVREAYGLELGLAGMPVVEPRGSASTLYQLHTIAKPGEPPSHTRLATLRVDPDSAAEDRTAGFHRQMEIPHAVASIDSFKADFDRPADKSLLLAARMGHAHLAKRADDPAGKGVEWEDHPVQGMDNRKSDVSNTTRKMAWKDTYLVGRGETADILLDASNPGRWMALCHIAEHLETMMMFNYRVE